MAVATARLIPLPSMVLAAIAMLAFAGNSVLCRLALVDTTIDAASFTVLRITSGAIMLWLLLSVRRRQRPAAGNWTGALALTIYAAAFTLAYLRLDTGTGALLLFGAVQLSMLGFGLVRGERLGPAATMGLVLATVGVLALLLPGSSAPSLGSALLMLLSGLAWGVYSLLGRGSVDPLAATADNFLRSVPLTLLAALPFVGQIGWDTKGALYAILSGALTSALGYAIWYSALRGLGAIQAASLQLSVPILAAMAGVLLLGEPLTLRLMIAAVAVIGGLAMVLRFQMVQARG